MLETIVYAVIAALVVAWLVFGVYLAILHGRDVRECQHYLRAHQGEDSERDGMCWQTLHEGQG